MLGRLRSTARAFRREESGQIAVVFGLTLLGILLATGGGLDLSRAYQARQKLSEVATLACQYARRPSVVAMASSSYVPPNGGPTYTSAVTSYIDAALTSQQFGWTQTNGAPFTYAADGPADVSLAASVPTSFMRLANVTQMPVAAASHCFDNPTAVAPPTSSPYLVQESFEAMTCPGCRTLHDIAGSANNVSTSNPGPTPVYTGATGASWFGTGYCLETDAAGIIKSTVAEGNFSAELDCDNGSGSAGNSAISSRIYMPVGNYELRYNYASRVLYPNYEPTYICGTAAADVSWANDTNSSGGPVPNALRTNQINVYLDPNTTGTAPLHTTIDGTQQLAGSNLIDTCVYAMSWAERSVRIFVTSPGHYWLTFAADGQNDSYGGQLDNVRLCAETCPSTVRDNFPAGWLAVNNGGVTKQLFRDRFESPVYASFNCAGNPCASNGNINLSRGTSGTASSGWPSQAAAGWAAAPFNQIDYYVQGLDPIEGAQYVELDGSTGSGATSSNRLISRRFLLMPGHYQYQYSYMSRSDISGVSGAYCGATPTAAGLSAALPAGYDTNIVATFMSHSDLASTPNGGGALYSATTYRNPNGTTTTTPAVAPNGFSLTSYNAAQPNPMLDICGYGTTPQARTRNILITKPAFYWLTASASGQSDNGGGAIDDVRLTALGSLYMASPPSSPVTIPVPNPQPGTRITYSGFYIIADPLTPTAPLQ